MQLSVEGLELIQRFEGFSPVVYRCPAGIPTIGYGHVVRQKERFSGGITVAEAVSLLRGDVRVAEEAVARLIHVTLAQGQFDALVSFTFNLGAGQLQASTLRRVINRGEHHAAPAQLMRWVFAGGRKLPGLVRAGQKKALFIRVRREIVSSNRHKRFLAFWYGEWMEKSPDKITPQRWEPKGEQLLPDGRRAIPHDQYVAANDVLKPTPNNKVDFPVTPKKHAASVRPEASAAHEGGELVNLAARRAQKQHGILPEGRKALPLNEMTGSRASRPEVLEQLRAQVSEAAKAKPAAKAPLSYEAQMRRDMETQHKVGLAASLLIGSVSLFGAWNNLTHVVNKDEDGKSHIDGANLMWGIVNLSLAAVNAAFVHHAIKHGSHAAIG